MNEELFIKAGYLWHDFKEVVTYKSRYFIDHPVLNIVKSVCNKREITLKENSVMYRARIYTDDISFIDYLNDDGISSHQDIIDQKRKTNFWAYDERNSYIPADRDKVKGSRANPDYIAYLYAADNPYTSMIEVRPYKHSYVNISAIVVSKNLKLSDFSNYSAFADIKEGSLDDWLLFQIMTCFQTPIDNDPKQYIPTQCISEYIRNLGFDGFMFRSSLDVLGCNYVIFNTDFCKPINSQLYKVSEIYYECECVAPKLNKPSSIQLELDRRLLLHSIGRRK